MALPGSLGGRDEISFSGNEGGRLRAIGVSAALPVTPARPRRWCDAGPPKADQKAGAERIRNSSGGSSDSDRGHGP